MKSQRGTKRGRSSGGSQRVLGWRGRSSRSRAAPRSHARGLATRYAVRKGVHIALKDELAGIFDAPKARLRVKPSEAVQDYLREKIFSAQWRPGQWVRLA